MKNRDGYYVVVNVWRGDITIRMGILGHKDWKTSESGSGARINRHTQRNNFVIIYDSRTDTIRR